MIKLSLEELYLKLESLCVFRSLRADKVIKSLINLSSGSPCGSETFKVSAYSAFVSALFTEGYDCLYDYVKKAVFDCENIYTSKKAKGENIPLELEQDLGMELDILSFVSRLTPEMLSAHIEVKAYIPIFRVPSDMPDIKSEYLMRIENISKYGYGIYSSNVMFRLSGEGESLRIIPVRSPDKTRLSDLPYYEREKGIILDNTRALLTGKPASNMLLTGDAGTGKSSTVKAVVNELCSEGLRIVELKKDELRHLPELLDILSENPLKFILFIDDLSFTKDDDNFSALKAALEGSVSSKSDNVIIYATSNRRHLVKESFQDRDGDDIHHNDTVQEIISLSERFGLRVTFERPNKETFLKIVKALLDGKGISYDEREIELEAERFVLGKGIRSPRAAKQFVDIYLSK